MFFLSTIRVSLQGNEESLVDLKVGRYPGEHGLSKSVNVIHFPSVGYTLTLLDE